MKRTATSSCYGRAAAPRGVAGRVARREQFRNAITFTQYMGYAAATCTRRATFLRRTTRRWAGHTRIPQAVRGGAAAARRAAPRRPPRRRALRARSAPAARRERPSAHRARRGGAEQAAAASPPLPAAADPIVLDDWLLSGSAGSPPTLRRRRRAAVEHDSGAASALDDADAEVAAHAEEAVGQALWAGVEALRRFEADEDVSTVERPALEPADRLPTGLRSTCAVFVMRKYFQLRPRSTLRAAPRRRTGRRGGGDDLRVRARHACSLLAESNPTLVEALRSPLSPCSRGGSTVALGKSQPVARRGASAPRCARQRGGAGGGVGARPELHHPRPPQEPACSEVRARASAAPRSALSHRSRRRRRRRRGTAVAACSPARAGRGDGAGRRGARAHRNARARRAAGARDGWTADRDARLVRRHQPAGARRGGRARPGRGRRRPPPRSVRRALCAHGRGGGGAR